MNNVLLGKTLKAMYKLSGKTLTQLSDETVLSVDTINNLFYARIQKPALRDVQLLTRAMGFSMHLLLDFMEDHAGLPEDADVTELFSQYTAPDSFAETTAAAVEDTEPTDQNQLLDRFRSMHLRYEEKMQAQHEEEIRRLEAHYAESLNELKNAHLQEREAREIHVGHLKKLLRILGFALGIETALFVLFTVVDMMNRSFGWLR